MPPTLGTAAMLGRWSAASGRDATTGLPGFRQEASREYGVLRELRAIEHAEQLPPVSRWRTPALALKGWGDLWPALQFSSST